MINHVFLDLDGVLVDFVQGACDFHKIENPYLNSINHGKWDLAPLCGISGPDFWGPLDMDFWANLRMMPDALDILQLLFNHFNLNQITLLTSPINNYDCASGKILWIKKYLPGYNRQFLIGPAKHAIAGPGKLLIDDYDKSIDDWRKHGGEAIQVPRLWNRMHDTNTYVYLKATLDQRTK